MRLGATHGTAGRRPAATTHSQAVAVPHKAMQAAGFMIA
jgi:hypothetical protein